jgi:hypothetical protein
MISGAIKSCPDSSIGGSRMLCCWAQMVRSYMGFGLKPTGTVSLEAETSYEKFQVIEERQPMFRGGKAGSLQ